jgi:hypothetical protein
MGLDIVAMNKAKLTADGDAVAVYNANGFDCLDGKPEGRYTGETEIHFRAGSYGGYNDWRKWLSYTFLGVTPEKVWENPEKFAGKPFVELINFGDNEGTFGPVTSAKLAKDFQDNLASVIESDSWEREKYVDWQRAFELAADDGFVILN